MAFCLFLREPVGNSVSAASLGWQGRLAEGKSDSLLWQLSATLWPKLRWVAWLTHLYYMTALFSLCMEGVGVLGGDSRKRKLWVWPPADWGLPALLPEWEPPVTKRPSPRLWVNSSEWD